MVRPPFAALREVAVVAIVVAAATVAAAVAAAAVAAAAIAEAAEAIAAQVMEGLGVAAATAGAGGVHSNVCIPIYQGARSRTKKNAFYCLKCPGFW